jgi:E3 ubiquitin-protein ligase SHPRH
VQILVFSTWTDVLDLVSHALHSSGVQHCYGNTGAKLKGSLDAFKSEADKQVLLLLLKRAGAGLNIVEAQHAFLIEPSTDPAVEAQVCSSDVLHDK